MENGPPAPGALPPETSASMSVTRASQLLNVSGQTIRNWLERGVLDGSSDLLNERHRWTVDAASVYRLLARQAEGAGADPTVLASAARASSDTAIGAGPATVLAGLLEDALAKADALERQNASLQQELAAARGLNAGLRARLTTREADLALRSEAADQLMEAFESGLAAQQALTRMVRSERRALDQHLVDETLD